VSRDRCEDKGRRGIPRLQSSDLKGLESKEFKERGRLESQRSITSSLPHECVKIDMSLGNINIPQKTNINISRLEQLQHNQIKQDKCNPKEKEEYTSIVEVQPADPLESSIMKVEDDHKPNEFKNNEVTIKKSNILNSHLDFNMFSNTFDENKSKIETNPISS